MLVQRPLKEMHMQLLAYFSVHLAHGMVETENGGRRDAVGYKAALLFQRQTERPERAFTCFVISSK